MAKGKKSPHAQRALYTGNPLLCLHQFKFSSGVGFSTQSPDHLLLLHFDVHFRVISEFLDWILFDNSRPEHHTSQLTGSRWDLGQSG